MLSAFFLFLVVFFTVGTVNYFAAKREQKAVNFFPPNGQILDVNGVSVHAMQIGEGPDVVLIHGASGSIRDYTFVFANLLAEHYRVTIIDRPGLGWTNQITDAQKKIWTIAHASPQEQARLLKSTADQMGVKRPIVVGHSFGGIVAMAWALEFEDVAAVVSIAGVANPWPGDLGWFYKINGTSWGGALVIPFITAFAPSFIVKKAIESIFAPQNAPTNYLAYVGPALTLRRGSMRANARQVNWLRPHVVEISKKYGEICIPVEIIHGDADTIVPLRVHSISLPDQIMGAKLTVLEGVGHMPHHTNPKDVIAAIDRAATRACLR